MISDRPAPPAARWSPLAWLSILGAIAVGLALLPRLLDYFGYSWSAIWFPWQIDYDEGVNINASWLLSQGFNIYGSNPPGHFVSALYSPLFYILNAAAIKLWGLNIASGRLLSFTGALSIAALLWVWVYTETRRIMPGLVAAALWLSLGIVYAWSSFYKQDMPALALGLLGMVMISAGSRQRVESSETQGAYYPLSASYRALLPLALSFWFKQSSLAPLLAVGLFLLLRNRRLALWWGAIAAAAIVLPFAALDLLLQGGLLTHLFAFNDYGLSLARLSKNMGALWTAHWPLIAAGALFLAATLRASVVHRRTPPLSTLYLLVAIPSTFLGNSLPTANYHHLLDLLAPLCLAVGLLLAYAERAALTKPLYIPRSAIAVPVLALAFLQVNLLYNKPNWEWYTPLAMPLPERAARMEKVSELVKQAPGDIYSEDDWILLKNGKRVLYDDPATIAALANSGRWDQSTLLQDLNRRKFSYIITQVDLAGETLSSRWSDEALKTAQANYQTLFRDVLYVSAPRPPAVAPEKETMCSLPAGPKLQGYTFRSTTANHDDTLPLNLYWQAPSNGQRDPAIKYFVRLVDEAGAAKWQVDLQPGAPAGKPWPAGWAGGQVVRDDLAIPVGQDLAYGAYQLQLGVYSVGGAGKLLPLDLSCSQSSLPLTGGAIVLSGVQLVERWGK